MQKFKNQIVTILAILFSLPIFLSAIIKVLTNMPFWGILSAWDSIGHFRIIGIIEFSIATLFVFIRTRYIGFFLLCSYLGGAIAISLQNRQLDSLSICLLIAYWGITFLQNSKLFIPDTKEKVLYGVVLKKI